MAARRYCTRVSHHAVCYYSREVKDVLDLDQIRAAMIPDVSRLYEITPNT